MKTPLDIKLLNDSPLMADLRSLKEVTWFNKKSTTSKDALSDVPFTEQDVQEASNRLSRFSPFIKVAFPETGASNGIIESELVPIPTMKLALEEYFHFKTEGKLFLKKDSHLPVAGSIKARGGVYEVLKHAETLAIKNGMLNITDDYKKLHDPSFKSFFNQYKIAVGSTGNLGLSIGIISAAIGFKATIHMSADARQWKKDLLRQHGVTVVEYDSDYSAAVEEGRKQAAQDEYCHFIDDENSPDLFLGYAVAGERLKHQLTQLTIKVDDDHPLFVYLPCGVGGGPGGITFGLKLAFGDNVHCLFAEPTHSPCMLLGVYTGLHEKISVYDIGIDNVTAADGLAVARPSGFVGRAMQRLIDGYYTVSDHELFKFLAMLNSTENIQLEPSATAGIPGIARVVNETRGYLKQINCDPLKLSEATHIVWGTGGSMVPGKEMAHYINQGK